MVFIEYEFSVGKHPWPTWRIRIPMMAWVTKRKIWMVHPERLTLICKIWCLLLTRVLLDVSFTLTHHRVHKECRLPVELRVLILPMMFSPLGGPTPSAVACLMVITPVRLRKTWTWDLVLMILLRIFCDLGTMRYLTFAMRDVSVSAVQQREVHAPTAFAHLLDDPLLW
jgi:hypothetical protein